MCPWGIQVKVPEVNWDYQSRAGERHMDWNARFEGHHPASRGLIYTSGLSSEALTQIECNIGPSGKKNPKTFVGPWWFFLEKLPHHRGFYGHSVILMRVKAFALM